VTAPFSRHTPAGAPLPLCYKRLMATTLYKGDLPDGLLFGDIVAIDTETMGLDPNRDRLCVVQLSRGDGDAHLVQFPAGKPYGAPNLKRLLADPAITKLFHFGRFDIAMLYRHLGVLTQPVWCTKIASKLVRTYTDRHGLRDLCSALLGVEISKQQQTSDWGAARLSDEQLAYAASDVLHLHRLKVILDGLLDREGRRGIAESCFAFLPARAQLDLLGWSAEEIFAH
jgi:ribonuclease D